MTQFLSHPIPAVVILLGLLVFFHEFGHFIVGRLCGIAVETFSIGFGPRIFGFTHQGTEYRLSWIPLGGYVKFAGAHPSEEIPAGIHGQGFLQVSLARRAAAVVAGPLANFILAIIVYTILGASGIAHPPALIGEVIEGSPAAIAGIRYGDRMVRIDDREIKTWRDLEEIISTSPGKALRVTLAQGGDERTVTLTPDAVPTTDMAGRPVTLGRAGVALGRPPAMLAVLAPGKAGVLAGVKTGDEVLEVNFQKNTTKVRYLPDFTGQLRLAAAAGQDTVTVTVHTAAIPTEKAEKSDKTAGSQGTNDPAGLLAGGPPRSVNLGIAALRTLATGASDRDLLAALGLGDATLTVGEAMDTAAGKLHKGDVLLAWNGKPIRDVYGLRDELIANTASEARIDVLRNLERTTIAVPLKGIEAQKPEGPVTIYTLPIMFWGQSIEPDSVMEKYDNPLSALAYGLTQTKIQTDELVKNVVSLATGQIPLKALGGPMLIAKVAGDSARRGWQTFLGSMALISINLGLLNLFPIPVLDGGQLLLMGAEAVSRRPLREAAVENFQKIGFALILALVVLATYNDLSRFWRSMLQSVVGLFQ